MDAWDEVTYVPNGIFENLVNDQIVAGHALSGLHRKISADANNEATYTEVEDESLARQSKLADKYGLPKMIYGRPIPKIGKHSNPMDIASAAAQGKAQANNLVKVSLPYMRPGDSFVLDLEIVSVPQNNPKNIKFVQEWYRMSPMQRMAFISAYFEVLDNAQGGKATLYTLPGVMKRLLPYPLPGDLIDTYKMSPAQVAKYNRDYERLAENRPLWIVDSFDQDAREGFRQGGTLQRLLVYPALFGWPPAMRQIALAARPAGNFALAGPSAVDFASETNTLDQNTDNRSLHERIKGSYKASEVSFGPGHKNRWAVAQIQNALRKEGLWDGPSNGIYDSKLVTSVEESQKRYKLPVSAVVDYLLLSALPDAKVVRIPAKGTEISPDNGVR